MTPSLFAVDPSLPIYDKVETIKSALERNQVVIVAGETGSGKSTQLPKICLELFQNDPRLIGHTQPRRLAARTIADRIAEETHTPLGVLVGYKIRFNDQMQKSARLKLMTDGILLAEMEHDRLLSKYNVIIIDEAHERSLNIDFLLGYLKSILPKRPDLKVIITSATLDHQRFSDHFSGAPLIEVSGRTYPVEVRYRPLFTESREAPLELQEGVARAIEELMSIDRLGGDILVFLSTEREIRECQKYLEKKSWKGVEILPLFGRLSIGDQHKIFTSRGSRKIVLSTNVAETSVTVPGVHYVIDSGLARLSRYSHRSKLQRLPIEPISQASANQRMGRCGRVAPGVCIRLYSEEDFHSRKPFTEPEILRTNLASVILKMAVMKLGAMEDFPFLTPPDPRFVKDGYRLLHELGAMNEAGTQMFPLGRTLSRFSVDPRLAKILTVAHHKKVLGEMLIIASFLSIPDVRERPMNHQPEADAAHRTFWCGGSDFLTILMLWGKAVLKTESMSERRKFCQSHFLSFIRLREWADLYQQLSEQVNALGWDVPSVSTESFLDSLNHPGFQAKIHQSLLSGLLSHIGRWEENKRYQGTRQAKLDIFPGSVAFPHPPKWMMCYELVETHKPFARMVGKMDPLWLESLASHLIKKSYSDPFYEEESGRVCAWMKLSLYGLDVIPKRRVNYGDLNPSLSREIFIKEALVNDRLESMAPFMRHNRALEEDLLPLERKARRLDVLIDDESRFRFYDQRIPKSVVDSITFNAWWKAAEREKSGLMESLNMTESDLISAVSHEEEEFPDEWNCPPFTFSLRYHFDPMSADDGVTVSIPALLFREVPQAAFEWLVPGLLLEKITALIRSLPKSKRRAFIPVPNVAKSCQEALKGVDHRESLLSNIALVLNRFSGISIAIEEFNLQELSPHLFMRVEILNEKGEVISIYRQGYEKPPEEQSYLSTGLPLLGSRDSSWEREGVSCWDFGPFPERLSTQFHGTSIALYPAIQDKGSAVDLVLESTLEKAAELSRRGILRLCFIELQKERGECRLQSQEVDGYLSFARQVFGVSERILREDLEMGVVMRVCGEFDSPDAFPRTQEAFERIISSRVQFLEVAKELARQGTFLLTEYVRLTKKIKKLSGQLFLSENLSDLNLQLSELFYAGFISSTPLRYFKRLSVYLKGADIRLERLMNHPAKDQEGRIEFERKRLVLSEKWMIEELRLQAFSTGLAGLK